jgi:hypothetical protein
VGRQPASLRFVPWRVRLSFTVRKRTLLPLVQLHLIQVVQRVATASALPDHKALAKERPETADPRREAAR